MSTFNPGHDDSKNECRNCDINNFVLAAEEAVRRGYYVIRMGAKVLKPFECNSGKIIDYAFSGTLCSICCCVNDITI